VTPGNRGIRHALLVGLLAGATALGLVHAGPELSDALRRSPDPIVPDLVMRIDGLPAETLSRLAIPVDGWTLELALDGDGPLRIDEPPRVILQQAGTEKPIPGDAFERLDDRWRVRIGPGTVGLVPGRLAIRASVRWADLPLVERELEVELRRWLVGPPIGKDQVVYFDFGADHSGDGRPDFETDLERFGLATPDRPELARRIAKRIASRALERTRRAYQGSPASSQGERGDPVAIELRIEPPIGGEVTRICVGGADPSGGHTVGNVRFDPANADRSSVECDTLPPTGIFPRSLWAYHQDRLFRATFDSLIPARGGVPLGEHPLDEVLLSAERVPLAAGSRADAMRRRARLKAAIALFSDVLGTIMAHESGHALGLVAPGPPEAGLNGGREGPSYAHGLPRASSPDVPARLMDSGGRLSFAQLAGLAETGELRFDPLHHAYLRDRIVLRGQAAAVAPRRESAASSAAVD
jgi:hypothetical protein